MNKNCLENMRWICVFLCIFVTKSDIMNETFSGIRQIKTIFA